MGMSKEKRNQDSPGTVRWSVSRATITFVLYAASVVQIGIILKPFVDMIPDTKDCKSYFSCFSYLLRFELFYNKKYKWMGILDVFLFNVTNYNCTFCIL